MSLVIAESRGLVAGPLQGVNFHIAPGLTFVRGGEGCGKTTLLRLLAGQQAPEAGTLNVTARTVLMPAMADAALDDIQARDWLASLRTQFPGWDEAAVDGLVDAFGLADHIHKPLYMLSTGSRRKVGLVAAAAANAELTLLDMPFAALDAGSCRHLLALLHEAAALPQRAWVVADYALPAGLDPRAPKLIELGDEPGSRQD